MIPVECVRENRTALPLKEQEAISLSWHPYINTQDIVHQGTDCDTMTIRAQETHVLLTNGPGNAWQQGEYRNAFVLTQPIAIPDDGRTLVIQGRPEWQDVQGSYGLWAHATGIFNNQGVMVTDGFAGGASGFAWMGNLSSRPLRGWTYQQAEGWNPNLLCFGKTRIATDDLLEIRLTKETTLFIVNRMIVKRAKTNIRTQDVVGQVWLDNYAIGLPFRIGYGEVTKNQSGTFHGIRAFYGK